MRFGEVLYYFRCKLQENIFTLALVSMYSDPYPLLFNESGGTVLACRHNGDSTASLIIIDFTAITSVVGMVPHSFSCLSSTEDWRFVVEKTWIGHCEARWDIRQ